MLHAPLKVDCASIGQGAEVCSPQRLLDDIKADRGLCRISCRDLQTSRMMMS